MFIPKLKTTDNADLRIVSNMPTDEKKRNSAYQALRNQSKGIEGVSVHNRKVNGKEVVFVATSDAGRSDLPKIEGRGRKASTALADALASA